MGCCNLKLDKLLEEIKFVKDKLNKVEKKKTNESKQEEDSFEAIDNDTL